MSELNFEFLLNKVSFDIILVNEVSDAEQFFLDINDGLDLKNYEIFKAELYHHAKSILSYEDFKRFALKMENEWLKFFLQYTKQEYTEEEFLVFFLKYCFRMMWIEENKNDDGYLSSNVRWLKMEHLRRIEKITDAIINKLKDVRVEDNYYSHSCICYSYGSYANRGGQQWRTKNIDYIGMLQVFLKNIWNTKEVNKDVVIWCYISKLFDVSQKEEQLNEYLRFIKKLLNNYRNECKVAEIRFKDWGVEKKEIDYGRYYVSAIPQYYLDYKTVEKNNTEINKNILNMIVIMNSKVNLNEEYLDICLGICKNSCSDLEEILKKEKKKKNSDCSKQIQEYEDYIFINGLVDNFIDYTENSCQLKEWVNDDFKEFLDKIKITYGWHNENPYKDILKYIYENKVSLVYCLVPPIDIKWTNYGGHSHSAKGTLIVHTWYDLFTSESGIGFDENSSLECSEWPDGWIENNYIIQPEDNDTKSKDKGFAAWNRVHRIFSINNFYDNFSYILKGKQDGKYNINGKEEDNLPSYLEEYESEKAWISEKLSETEKIYYSEKKYLNEILLGKDKRYLQKLGKDLSEYKKDCMHFIDIDGRKFFIKWTSI